ncbi:MAG: hypothetical protein FWG07_01455 [Treponema sp.]|nr:hypothetical protein [Treponema sp.]
MKKEIRILSKTSVFGEAKLVLWKKPCMLMLFFILGLPLMFVIPAGSLHAQTSRAIHEPNSEIYKDIDRWYVQGYIREFLPLIRPYPITLIEKILDEVILNGDTEAQQKAGSYRKYFMPPSRFIHFGASAFMQGKNKENGFLGMVSADGTARITELLSASFNLTILGMTDLKGERFNVPGTYSLYSDKIDDISNIGALELLPVWTSLMALGNSGVYFQAGLARTSFGPFYDNGIIVGPQVPRAGHFSFVFYRPKWSYEVLFQSIIATDDFGKGQYSDKYNVIHAINFRPFINLETGFIQTITFGGRLEPMYFVPFTFLFASQSMGGFYDNAFMGLYVRWRPFDTFLTQANVYADDISFNGLFSGETRFKIALEGGLSWVPRSGVLSSLDFDYTAVFPYTYTHWHRPNNDRYDPGKPNYLNYTHMGRNIGPDLEPNSDRFSLRTNWKTIPDIDLNLSLYLTRHGNSSEGFIDSASKNPGDGSIFDDGTDDSGFDWDNKDGPLDFNPRSNLFLLTQNTLDTRLGGTIGISWAIPGPVGVVFKLMGEYGLQYGWNRSVDRKIKPGNNGFDQYWSIGGMLSW